jgi:hypothetical protein
VGTFDPNKRRKKFVFEGLLGSLGRIEKTISKLKM